MRRLSRYLQRDRQPSTEFTGAESHQEGRSNISMDGRGIPAGRSRETHSRSVSMYTTSVATPPLGDIDFPSARRSRSQRQTVQVDTSVASSGPPTYDYALAHPQPTATSSSGNEEPAAQDRAGGNRAAAGYTSPESIENPLRALARYDVVFLIDDSASMFLLWSQARDAMTGVVEKAILYDSDGIDIYFLNSEHFLEGCTVPQAVGRLFQQVRPSGSTPTAIRMDEVLRPYVDSVEDCKRERMPLPKPKVVICITDGRADDPDMLKDILVEMAGRLDYAKAPPFQLGIQFIQIGSDPDATAFLRELDDDLKAEHSVRDMVDTVEYKGRLDSEFILQCCLGSVNRRLDARSH